MEKREFKDIVRAGWLVLVHIFALVGFVLVVTYIAVRFGLTNEKGIIDLQREAFLGSGTVATTTKAGISVDAASDQPKEAQGTPWYKTEEWQILAAALTKDQTALNNAAAASGVPSRLIAANLVTEQLRLFFTERAFYKQFFAPLKILGSQTQFSWGVMGMKPDTAIEVENNLKDPTSPYYLGDSYAHLLDFPAGTTDISEARFTRMTDQHNHYWSYLYAGLYIKQVEAQWTKAGFPIDQNVAVLSTLYNIGFEHSQPNSDPQVGGAQITILGTPYSFGGLAAEFYNSDQLTDILPK